MQAGFPVVRWVEDWASHECQLCAAEFHWLWNRRHHCRSCGKLLCHSCCSNSVPLPHLGLPKPVRICSICLDEREKSSGEPASDALPAEQTQQPRATDEDKQPEFSKRQFGESSPLLMQSDEQEDSDDSETGSVIENPTEAMDSSGLDAPELDMGLSSNLALALAALNKEEEEIKRLFAEDDQDLNSGEIREVCEGITLRGFLAKRGKVSYENSFGGKSILRAATMGRKEYRKKIVFAEEPERYSTLRKRQIAEALKSRDPVSSSQVTRDDSFVDSIKVDSLEDDSDDIFGVNGAETPSHLQWMVQSVLTSGGK